jgi:hypothetical protein
MDAESKQEATTDADAKAATELVKEHTTASREEIVRTLADVKGCSIESISSHLVKEVEGLDDPQLIAMYQRLWKDIPRAFSSLFNINGGNFASWLSRQRLSSPPSRKAVRGWLLKLLNNEVGTNYPEFHRPEYTAFQEHCINNVNVLTEQLKLATDRRAVTGVLLRRLHQGLDTVLFVDADSCGHVVREFDAKSSPNTHIVCGLRRGIVNRHIYSAVRAHPSHISYVVSGTVVHDATDHLLTILMTILDCSLPTSIAFYLVTQDHFAGEVCHQLTAARRCEWIYATLKADETWSSIEDYIRERKHRVVPSIHFADPPITLDEIEQLKKRIAKAKAPIPQSELTKIINSRRGFDMWAFMYTPSILRQLDAQICIIVHPVTNKAIPVIFSASSPPSTCK